MNNTENMFGDPIISNIELYSTMPEEKENTSIEDKKLQGKVTNTFVKGEELFKI